MEKTKLDRNIFWMGTIDHESCERVIREITALIAESDEEDINLHIASQGGLVDAGLAFYDYVTEILDCSALLNTRVLSEASSAALLVWCAGGMRYMTLSSTLLFHQVRRHYYSDSDLTMDDLSEDLRVMQEKENKVYAIMHAATRGKMTREMFDRLQRERTIVDVRTAEVLGLIRYEP